MKRVLLILSQAENQRLLAEELEDTFEVIVADGDDALDQPFDLCVVDGRSLDQLRQRVQERKEREKPIFLPFLLVTSRPGVKMITNQLWRCVDELIITPIEKPELQARIEILLRVRSLSLALRRRAEEADQARQAAMDASHAKSEFLANMSHELRTPINAITGYTDLLELGISGPLTDQQSVHLGRIKFSTDHLLSLVNEVLNLARVESGRLQVEPERVSVAATVRDSIDLIAPQAAARGVEFHDGIDGTDAAYWGDPERVRQILVNLFSNAVRFTEPGGQVSLSCRIADDPVVEAVVTDGGPWIALDVEDTGIGIPPGKVASVFEPFVQVDTSHTRVHDGTGLGLTISRRLARLMSGDLTVRSELGRGSTFTWWRPAACDEPGERRKAPRPADGAIQVPRLGEVGRALVRSVDAIMREFGDLLQEDPVMPGAGGLDRAQLENHTATFLVDIGRALVTLDEGGGEAELMRDGTEIQRTISMLHGGQRARLGWPADAVHREFQLLRKVTSKQLHAALPAATGDSVDDALGIVHRLLDQAERVSLRGWQREETE